MDQKLLNELNRLESAISLEDEVRLLRALIYGDTGAGKTTLAAHLVENKGALVTTDSAWVVLYKYPEIAKKIVRYPFEGFSQLRAICQAHSEGIEPYSLLDTLIIDTASTAISNILRALTDAMPYDPKQNPSEGVEGWPQYRLAERSLVDTIKVLNRSKLNIIYLAHPRDPSEKDKDKKRFAIRPDMPEACYKAIAREVQLIGWLYKEKEKPRQIQFEGTLQVTAKSQISTIEEKTYSQDQIPELVQKWKSR